jgi:2-keto-4-pentenoate hydratase
VGQLPRERCHAHGVHLQMPDAAPVTIECEIAFRLAQDLAPDAPDIATDALIDSLCVTFEIVRSRFVDRRAAGWPSFVADNVGFEALVVGGPLPLARLQAVYDSLRLTVNDAPAAPLLRGDDAIDARAGLRALTAHARQYGITLRRDQLVSTGTMTKPFDLSGTGHTVCAHFLDQTLRFSL